MMETDRQIYVNNTQIENVESYIYLRQRYATTYKNQDNEIQRRITAGWTAFAKHRDIFKGNIGNDIWRGNKGTHHPCTEKASSRTNKDAKEYAKYHIPGQKKKTSG
ncbi:hypothetical protein NP493_87g08003 [Ridgeia piscesae]|uniref:Uncharacterized protein n=1 Tax=Ridgeia piscesae TaxID=27915 RepID=A0AAD9P8L1_RIDPI|nr:hypothetical protein NP493_87g08003 [Ridgeia piscesae]